MSAPGGVRGPSTTRVSVAGSKIWYPMAKPAAGCQELQVRLRISKLAVMERSGLARTCALLNRAVMPTASSIEPRGITIDYRSGLPAHGEDAFAAQRSVETVALEQMDDPGILGRRLVAKRAGFQAHDGESGILQQLLNLARRVLAVMSRVGFARGRRPHVCVKKSRMKALQNRRDTAQRRQVRRGQNQVAARFENAVHLRHQMHGILEQVLDKLAAQHG